jgi:nitrile hydratase subunit beta
MNGIHDMGGMQGLGEIGYQASEPMFPALWEGRVFALIRAMQVGSLRPYIERIPAADYLRMSYYERWYTAFITRLIEQGVVTRAEVERGQADPASVKETPAITPAVARELLFRTPREERDIALTPRFHVGDRVRGRNIHPIQHTVPQSAEGDFGVWVAQSGHVQAVFTLARTSTGTRSASFCGSVMATPPREEPPSERARFAVPDPGLDGHVQIAGFVNQPRGFGGCQDQRIKTIGQRATRINHGQHWHPSCPAFAEAEPQQTASAFPRFQSVLGSFTETRDHAPLRLVAQNTRDHLGHDSPV